MRNFIQVQDSWRNARFYNGNMQKFGITYDGANYIVKFAKDEDLSTWTEHIASIFIRALGIPCHETNMGTYNGEVVVVLLRDFTSAESALYSYKDIKQAGDDTENLAAKDYTYSDVLSIMDELKMPADTKLAMKAQFWDMFICDAILGNRDRHWGNWGFLEMGYGYIPAPIYDNGGCLFPSVYKVLPEYVNKDTRTDFLRTHIYEFPASIFKMEQVGTRPKRTNYYEMLGRLDFDAVYKQRVQRMRAVFTVEKIYAIICSIVKDLPLNINLKRFYVEIVTMRYACIVCRHSFEAAFDMVEARVWQSV